MKKSKKSEASLQLDKFGKHMKAFMTKAEFPVDDVPLTPSKSCCTYPTHKCPANPADWQHLVWQEVDFQIDDPHLFQYSYKSAARRSRRPRSEISIVTASRSPTSCTARSTRRASRASRWSGLRPAPTNGDGAPAISGITRATTAWSLPCQSYPQSRGIEPRPWLAKLRRGSEI